MMFIGYAVIFLFAIRQIGVKADMEIFLDDVDIVEIDPEYFDVEETDFYIVESSTGKSTITANMVVLKEIPAGVDASFNLIGMALGKYNLPTGFDYNMGFCKMLDDPVVLGPFLTVLGIKADECPPTPGTYHQEGYTVPMDHLPDKFVENKYKACFAMYVEGKSILVINIYLEVQ